MAKKKQKPKFYAIKKGFTDNVIVTSWPECQKLTKGCKGSIHHSFKTREEAEKWLSGELVIEKKPKLTANTQIQIRCKNKCEYQSGGNCKADIPITISPDGSCSNY